MCAVKEHINCKIQRNFLTDKAPTQTVKCCVCHALVSVTPKREGRAWQSGPKQMHRYSCVLTSLLCVQRAPQFAQDREDRGASHETRITKDVLVTCES